MCHLCLGKKETLPKHIENKQYPLLVKNGESDKQKKLSVFELQLVHA